MSCRVAALAAILLLAACKSVPKGPEGDWVMVQEKLGAHYESFPNASNEYLLCVQKQHESDPMQFLKFVVIRKKDNLILTEQSFSPGYIKWIDQFKLELLSLPGMIRENEDLTDYIKIIDIRSFF